MEFTAEQIPDTLTVEDSGAQIPLRNVPFIKEAPDLPTLLKTAYDAHREVGARVRIPGKDAKPEDLAAFKKRVSDAGIAFGPVAPATPKDYGIVKPETLPPGVTWNEPMAGELATILHKHGAPKELAADLIALHAKVMEGTAVGFQTDKARGIAALKQEFGDKYDELADGAGRLATAIFKTPEELAMFEGLGLGDHPGFLGILMRLAPLAQADSSFMAELVKGGDGANAANTREEARAEIAKMMGDPKHPMYEEYKKNTQKARDYIDQLYGKLATGTRAI